MGRSSFTPTDVTDLRSLGCLPPIDVVPGRAADGNLIAGLIEAWTEWRRVAPRNRRNRAARIESWLRATADQGAVFSFGETESGFAAEWLARRVCFWPRGIPVGPRVGIASSRLGRSVASRQPAFCALRAVVSGTAKPTTIFVVSSRSPLTDGTARACQLFDRRLVRIVADAPASIRDAWLDHLVECSRPGDNVPGEWPVHVSADAAVGPAVSAAESSQLDGIPDRDVALAAFTEQLAIVSLRRNGHWMRLLKKLLVDPERQAGSVRLCMGEQLCRPEVVAELQTQGAVALYLPDAPSPESLAKPASTAPWAPPSCNLIQSLRAESEVDTNWLIHWTRQSDAPWPGESVNHMLDSLLLGLPEADHSALASLVRIVSELRVRATDTGQRDARSSVSFTARTLRDLIHHRTFRAHRHRWDFEHTGIAIRREFLERAGARPVIYGDDATWSDMPEAERLWFQKRYSRMSAETIDWSVEQEWRFPADVDLSRIGPDDAFVFCPDADALAVLGPVSRWPVVVISDLLAD